MGNSQFIVIKVAHHFYEIVCQNPLPTLTYMDYEVLKHQLFSLVIYVLLEECNKVSDMEIFPFSVIL